MAVNTEDAQLLLSVTATNSKQQDLNDTAQCPNSSNQPHRDQPNSTKLPSPTNLQILNIAPKEYFCMCESLKYFLKC